MNENDLLKAKLDNIKNNLNIIKENENVIKLYHNYLYEVVELFDYLIQDKEDLFYTIVMDILIDIGYFSYNLTIQKNFMNEKEITTNLGINVILGKCCCRNIAYFYHDIFKHFFDYPLTLTCFDDEGIKNEKTMSFGNHMINLTKYHDTIYGFDLTNNLLYYPINKNTLKQYDKNYYIYYRKYSDIILRFYQETTVKDNFYEEIMIKEKLFKEARKKKIIPQENYQLLINEANNFIYDNERRLTTFLNKTVKLKEEIHEKMLLKK